MRYLTKNIKYILLLLLIFLFFNLYFIFLIPNTNITYLYYLDFLLLVFISAFLGIDGYIYTKQEKQKQELLNHNEVIYSYFNKLEDKDIIEHDIEILHQKLQQQYDINYDLQDYITKWTHEIKIPLAATLLMIEKIEDNKLKKMLKEQLEKINLQLKSALVGCKVQSQLYDLQIKKIDLLNCVQTSIKNNQFFLMKNQFDIGIHIHQIDVFSDFEWLVYVLDQLINNAIKYMTDNPRINIWATQDKNKTYLYIEDYGEGIKEMDIKRIFEKGYTGSNHHNGKYKSTGMGLYMVSMIIQKLGHSIDVESKYGYYTRFTITFSDHRDYFYL